MGISDTSTIRRDPLGERAPWGALWAPLWGDGIFTATSWQRRDFNGRRAPEENGRPGGRGTPNLGAPLRKMAAGGRGAPNLGGIRARFQAFGAGTFGAMQNHVKQRETMQNHVKPCKIM